MERWLLSILMVFWLTTSADAMHEPPTVPFCAIGATGYWQVYFEPREHLPIKVYLYLSTTMDADPSLTSVICRVDKYGELTLSSIAKVL